MLASINRQYVSDAWRFLIGENNSSHVLAQKVGFVFEKTVTEQGKVDYIHGASLIMLSPEGKITRYLNGVDQLPFDVKMALIEASDGTVGPTVAKAIEYCLSYDPKGKTYVFVWEKIAGVVMTAMTVLFFIYLVRLGRKEDDRDVVKKEKEE